MRPVVIVQHEPSVPPGTIEVVLGEEGIEHVVFEAWREREWPDPSEMSALVVLGGTMNVDDLDGYPLLEGSRGLLAAALERRLPTLGVCLGAQMMARVLGGDVHRAHPRNAHFSPLELTEEGAADVVMKPFASSQPVLQFHEDTFVVPENAVLLARSSRTGLGQAFRYGDHAYAVQFHFEVERRIVEGWIDNIGGAAMVAEWGVGGDDLVQQADEHLPVQSEAGRELIRNFLRSNGLNR